MNTAVDAMAGYEANRTVHAVDFSYLRARHQLDAMAFVKRDRPQGNAFDILLAGHEALGEWRALVGNIGLVADQRDRSLITFHAQRSGNLETGLPGSDDNHAVRLHCIRPSAFTPEPLLLSLRRPHDQAVQLLGHWYLAAQAAIRTPLRGGSVEHFVLIFLDRIQQAEKCFVDINVAGGALAGAAAFGDDAVNSIFNGAFHYRVTDRNGNRVGFPRVRDVGHRGSISLFFSKETHDCQLLNSKNPHRPAFQNFRT